jgi:hypothetical protein
MLIKAKDMRGLRLGARDGEIGKIKDFYFDDGNWVIRYLVADTGSWLVDRQVLISPHAVREIHSVPGRTVEVDLSRKQIEESPSIETDRPVSRQFEVQYYQYFNWPVYWSGPWEWGMTAVPGYWGASGAEMPPVSKEQGGDPHLRSGGEILHYTIQALNSHFGHVEDFILETQNWALRYLVVDTRNWWPGKRVLISPQWIGWVSWAEARVYIDLDRETVQRAPAYDPAAPLTRDYEKELFAYYGRVPYWEPPAGLPQQKAA